MTRDRAVVGSKGCLHRVEGTLYSRRRDVGMFKKKGLFMYRIMDCNGKE